MKNEVLDKLSKAGFKLVDNEWIKEDWTLRIENNTLEVFNNTKYFYGLVNKDLDNVLEDIK